MFLGIDTDSNLAPVSLQSLELHLEASTMVISNLGDHRHIDKSKIALIN
jgi:hypothetical protein